MTRRGTGALSVLLFACATSALASPPAEARSGKCSGWRPTIAGTAGADVITGTPRADVIRAGAGDDTVESLGRDDIICAGPGADAVDGGADLDLIRGGAGDDRISGGDGRDLVNGLGGHDSIDGGPETDSCFAEAIVDCEAQLSGIVELAGSPPYSGGADVTVGDDRVTMFVVYVSSGGPSPSPSTYAEIDLPLEGEVVPEASGPNCVEGPAHELTCGTGAVGPRGLTSAEFGLRFPDCPAGERPPGGRLVRMTGRVDDPNTNPPNSSFNPGRFVRAFGVLPAPSCPPQQ